jgi:hypothetical protein
MAIKTLTVKFTGISPLLQNNPRSVNPLDKVAQKANQSYLAWKKNRTEDGFLESSMLAVETKLYWNNDIGVYVPTRWVMASLAKKAFAILGKGYSKDAVRGAIFPTHNIAKLSYDGDNAVKKIEDIYRNEKFTTLLILPQGQIRLPKSFPIFHKWSFETELEYDDNIFSSDQIERVLSYTAKYNGFGDFRPSYGRCLAEVTND